MSTTESEYLDLLEPDKKYYYELSSGDEEEEGGGGQRGSYYAIEGPIKYRTEDFISRAKFSPNCDIEENILEFDFSYGYDCKKPYNLVVVDDRTIIFASGNLIHFFDVETLEIWFRRSAKGGGIGHITNNPMFPHFAVGENGKNPPIIVYEWPSLEIVCVLRGGTGRSKLHTHLNYSPNGDLLVSQAGEPDYLITVWNWSKAVILLRTRSYMNDVFRVMFSPFVPGHLTSSGVAHIKFWKIAQTFTGLKLQGNLGRFGKTEYSDIVGIFPMADEKVISGCYWGNILVWEEGLIKLEVCRKNRKRCHDDAIVQFNYHHGELWTVSLDGHVKMWYYDTIDQADPPDDDRFCLMEPTYDFHTPGARFMSIAKQYEDPENTYYFAQDAKGAIWRIDLNIEEEAAPSERLLKSHAGITKGLAVCPWGPYFTTIGIGGWVHLYNYITRKLLMIVLFPAPGYQILWVPMSLDPSGETMFLAFGDGTIRVGAWKINETKPKDSKIHIIQILKPHNKPVTVMSLNRTGKIFVTGGEDKTIFVFKVVYEFMHYLRLVPIGFIPSTDIPSCFTWHNNNANILIVGCVHGQIMIVELPTEPVPYTKINYELQIGPITQRFHTYKSQIYRDILLKEIAKKKNEKRDRKMEQLKKLRNDNPGLDIDEELFLEDSEEEEVLPELYVPEEPNKIHWIQHTKDDTLWVSMAGYDAGFIYEYKIGQSDPIPYRFKPIEGAEDVDVANYAFSKNHEYLILGMSDGSIRVNRVNPDNWHDLSNYWALSMHDNYNGYIPGFSFSYDYEYFLTSGNDGNVFAFKCNAEDIGDPLTVPERRIPMLSEYKLFDNVNCNDTLSLQENIVRAESERLNKVANENKQFYVDQVQKLRERYELLLIENEKLPDSQKLTIKELTVDARIMADLEQKLVDETALVNRKFEFQVEKSRLKMMKLRKHFIDSMDVYPLRVKAIRSDDWLRTTKEHCLGDDFYDIMETVERKIVEDLSKGRPPERVAVTAAKITTPPVVVKKLEYFLSGLSPHVIEHKLGAKINRVLRKYRAKKEWKEQRKREWDIFNALKPAEGSIEEDEVIIKEAANNIGNFNLKSAENYKVPTHLRETTNMKYKQLLQLRERTYNLVHSSNLRVYELREEKRLLYHRLLQYNEDLKAVNAELMDQDKIDAPPLFEFSDEEYPEKEFEIRVTLLERPREEEAPPVVLPMYNFDGMQRAVIEANDTDPEEKEIISQWERHLRQRRYRQKLYEQELINRTIHKAIKHFDMILISARVETVVTRVEADLMHLHLFVLHQELLVLKECESKEDLLSDKVNQKLQEVMDLQDETAEVIGRIEGFKKEMEKLAEKEKEITKSFMSAMSDNKFFDFLRKIFKKKYKPPKVRNPDDSDSDSSSSSSEESEEDDAASIDSKDFNIIRLDESVCPKGCDINSYDMTFQLRSQRHEIEQQTKEFQILIEQNVKQREYVLKKTRLVENDLKKRQDELEQFQREKQKKLNQIMCTIILRLDQCKHIKPEGGFNCIRDTLVFNQRTLSSLYNRVSILDRERQQQTEKHNLSLLHLRRMESDFNYMTRTIKNLKKGIRHNMVIKFGSQVDINELEEYLLKKMIFNLRLSISDVKGMFDAEMGILYDKYKDLQKSMLRVLKQNTVAQDLLCMLRMEKSDLIHTQKHQKKVADQINHVFVQANKVKVELMKLDKVIKEQNHDIELLKREIKTYKTKGFVLPKTQVAETTVEEEEAYEEQSFVSEWGEMDDYMYTEAYAKEYWANKQLKEARKTRQEVIFSIMNELFKNMNIQLQRNMIVNMLKRVISDVMNNCDVREIIDNILDMIPNSDKLTDEQNSMIELTAEKLYSLDEFGENLNEDEEDADILEIRTKALEKLDDIAMEIFTEKSDNPVATITKFVYAILDTIPLHIVMEDSYMDLILNKVAETMPEFKNLNKEMLDSVELDTLEANIVLAEFLDRVFLDVKEEIAAGGEAFGEDKLSPNRSS